MPPPASLNPLVYRKLWQVDDVRPIRSAGRPSSPGMGSLGLLLPPSPKSRPRTPAVRVPPSPAAALLRGHVSSAAEAYPPPLSPARSQGTLKPLARSKSSGALVLHSMASEGALRAVGGRLATVPSAPLSPQRSPTLSPQPPSRTPQSPQLSPQPSSTRTPKVRVKPKPLATSAGAEGWGSPRSPRSPKSPGKSPKTPKAKAPGPADMDPDERAQRSLDPNGELLTKLLVDADVGLVKAAYLRRLARSGGIFQRRQDLQKSDDGSLVHGPDLPRQLEYCKLFVVSHAWMAVEHPDPAGHRLQELVDELENFGAKEWDLVFIDYCSLPQPDFRRPQEPRTEEGPAPMETPSGRLSSRQSTRGQSKMMAPTEKSLSKVAAAPPPPIDACRTPSKRPPPPPPAASPEAALSRASSKQSVRSKRSSSNALQAKLAAVRAASKPSSREAPDGTQLKPEEAASFKKACAGMDLVYGSGLSHVLVFTEVHDLKGAGSSFTKVGRKYQERGWCFFELAMATLCLRVFNEVPVLRPLFQPERFKEMVDSGKAKFSSPEDRAALSHVWERLQLTHKKDDVVAMIAEGLAEDYSDVIKAATGSHVAAVRKDVVAALGRFRCVSFAELIADHLVDPNPGVRAAACTALAQLANGKDQRGVSEAYTTHLAARVTDHYPEVRKAAVRGLYSLTNGILAQRTRANSGRPVPELLVCWEAFAELLGDDCLEACEVACKALAANDRAAKLKIEAIAACLSHPTPLMRVTALHALSRCGPKAMAYVDEMRELAEEDHFAFVKTAAESVLQQLVDVGLLEVALLERDLTLN